MIYDEFLGSAVGLLGFGAMRLPVVDGDQAAIDQPALDAMVDTAIASGVNYFDTAYPYHDGLSEVALGKSLARYPRDSYYLADKYPGHQIADSYNPAQIFEEQLAKCGVGHFDFYLLHNVYENSIDVYTDEKWGIADYFAEQKRLGRISHLGFSSHGRPDNLAAFLDYGARKYAALKEKAPEVAALFAGENIFEFCQIQLNYLDWTLQRAEEKCAMLENAGVPVVVMEPLRGGRLAQLEPAQMDALETAAAGRSTVEWSFRWLQGLGNVKVVLSGMSNLEQVQNNCRIFAERQPLAAVEAAALLEVAETLKGGVPCTACRYCVDTCPKQIDIPMMLATYNDLQFASSFTVSMQMDAVEEEHRAADCIDCRRCSRLCPQGIDIPEALSELAGALEKMPKWADLCRQREEAARALRQK
ncbi:aldo/keto reductase [Parvibacter caecicola]|uniref:4Fe-4S dicluster domain-containing protein n=1 Tax=Parvibacter caecicola TaxID=747645 RepID=A0A4T9T8B5_9ACTN|nr:aldo/keto reductase [Parvibacter caecicola]TJW11279.1 4Fe-4S dicluster domain-containing protein [Parvibacter caecicola]